MSKLWGGRFQGDADQRFSRFNASLPFDRGLLQYDLRCAAAHAAALRQLGILSESEAQAVHSALDEIGQQCRESPERIDQAIEKGIEDIHSFVEAELTARIGEAGLKLNTGRSRNDQAVTDLRLFLRDAVDDADRAVIGLQKALLELAEGHPDTPIPGYTHLQKAQSLLLPHYLLAYFEMFERDRRRLRQARERIDVCPLGSAALAGAGFPVDRRLLARLLGFESVSANSLDAVSDRDFVLDFTSAATLIMVHLSRLAEDWIIYGTAEFGFLEWSDAVATGSSLMPQKKNPDALELIRGKASRVLGHHTALLSLLKGLPLAYNKDLQEDKELLFDLTGALLPSLNVAAIVVEHTSFRTERLRKAVDSGFLNATDLADYLVRKGVPFRKAHELTGRVVLQAMESNRRLEDLDLEEFRRHGPEFGPDVYQALTLESSLAAKDVEGGTASQRVAQSLREARTRLGRT